MTASEHRTEVGNGKWISLKTKLSQGCEGKRKGKEGGEKQTHNHLLMNLGQDNSILRQEKVKLRKVNFSINQFMGVRKLSPRTCCFRGTRSNLMACSRRLQPLVLLAAPQVLQFTPALHPWQWSCKPSLGRGSAQGEAIQLWPCLLLPKGKIR